MARGVADAVGLGQNLLVRRVHHLRAGDALRIGDLGGDRVLVRVLAELRLGDGAFLTIAGYLNLFNQAPVPVVLRLDRAGVLKPVVVPAVFARVTVRAMFLSSSDSTLTVSVTSPSAPVTASLTGIGFAPY